MNSIDIDKTLDFNNLYQLKLFLLTTETLNILKRALENLSSLENKSSKPSKLNKFRTFRKHRKASKSGLMKMIARINDVWINDLQTALTGKMGEIGKKQKQVLTEPKRPEEILCPRFSACDFVPGHSVPKWEICAWFSKGFGTSKQLYSTLLDL